MSTTRNTRRLLGGLLVALSGLWGCEPGVIAPLPSPDQPDDGRIITSSLTQSADPDTDVLVAVVGFEGAVDGAAGVEVSNVRTGRVVSVSASEGGSFSAAAYGRSDDTLEVRQLDAQGRKSEPVSLVVALYPAKTAGAVGDPESPPAAPAFQDDTDAASGGTAENKRLDVIWQLVDGVLRLDANAGFTSPGDMVILANTQSGLVVSAAADATGAVRLELPAQPGDEMLLFNRATNNPSLTSPAVRFFVPSSGETGGTDT